MKKYQSFSSEKFPFLEVKFSIYLNKRLFVMRKNCFSQGLCAAFSADVYISIYFKQSLECQIIHVVIWLDGTAQWQTGTIH